MILPRRPVPGEPVTAQLIGRMIDYMRRITPLRGPGVLTQATPGGTVISAASSGGAPAAVGPFPYEVRAVEVPGTGGGAAQTVLAIYTPAGVLCIDNAVVSISDATAVASQGDGWYSYSGVVPPTSGQQTQIWLSVSWPTGTGGSSPTATIGTSAGSGSSSSIVRSVLLAKAARSSSGLLSVSQFVYSAEAFWRPAAAPTGTVEFVADGDWYVNGSTHVLRQRLRELDLATGQVTDKANTTYANGWEVMANSTPISGIINGGQS